MKDNNSKIIAILLAIVTIVVVLISLFLSNSKKDDDSDVAIVNSASQFFTVNSCLYRVTNYIYKKNTDGLIKVLNSKYKKDNKINKDNILEIFPNITQDSIFVSKKMYYKELTKDIIKYYVYGEIKPNILHDYTEVEESDIKKVYFIVILDSTRQLFSVEPYDGKIFTDGDANE